MNALQSYTFEEAPVRVVMIGANPWFVANDVAQVLGYRLAPHMVRMLDDDEKGIHIVDTLGGNQEMNIISESGLYAAILKSRRVEAKRFRKWVTSEVLPSLRRTGRYEMHPALDAPGLDEDIDPPRLTAALGIIREARQIWGREQVRKIWLSIGLPSPFVHAQASETADPVIEPVKAWIADKAEVTISQVAGGLGFDPEMIERKLRRRIAAALRLLGWDEEVERRSRFETARVWRPIPRAGEG